MKVTHVSIGPSARAIEEGGIVLCPELLSSVFARYSRSDMGIDSILKSVENIKDEDKKIDNIFNLAIDFGHRSVFDSVFISLALDSISIYTVYKLWQELPRAAGLETSTRYCRFDKSGMIPFEYTSIPADQETNWNDFLNESIDHYNSLCKFWENYLELYPHALNFPTNASPAMKARLLKNYIFDRSRYTIPSAALTNAAITLCANDWGLITRILLSSKNIEFQQLGAMIREKLAISAPRVLKHAIASPDWIQGHQYEFDLAIRQSPEINIREINDPKIVVEVWDDPTAPKNLAEGLEVYKHRYAFTPKYLSRIMLDVEIEAVTQAELRDLNRHKLIKKDISEFPIGMYCALDEIKEKVDTSVVKRAIDFGIKSATVQANLFKNGDCSHPYYGLLGTQYRFSFVADLNNLMYIIAIRSDSGSHFRYRNHVIEIAKLVQELYPNLSDKLLVGSGEPE